MPRSMVSPADKYGGEVAQRRIDRSVLSYFNVDKIYSVNEKPSYGV